VKLTKEEKKTIMELVSKELSKLWKEPEEPKGEYIAILQHIREKLEGFKKVLKEGREE